MLSIRAVKDFFKKFPFLVAVYRTFLYVKRKGIVVTYRKIRYKFNHNYRPSDRVKYCKLTKEERKRQEGTCFSRDNKFCILIAVGNRGKKNLERTLSSVVSQTYQKWEMCIVDRCDSDVSSENTARKLIPADKTVRYIRSDDNGLTETLKACNELSADDHIIMLKSGDVLHPSALFEVMTAICEKNADFVYSDEDTFSISPRFSKSAYFKPDFSPDTLRGCNYIGNLTAFKRSLLEFTDGEFINYYDLILKLTEKAQNIVHIPKILYYNNASNKSKGVSGMNDDAASDKKAILEHLRRVGLSGTVTESRVPHTYRINYSIEGEPLISIIIPNKDHIEDLDRCLRSISEKSTYKNYEIVIVENNSTEQETFDYYEKLNDEKIKVVKWEYEFNYSKINNFGFKFCSGEYILLLNNDVEVITPDWLEEMLMFAQRSDVGAVGAMLYYPNDTVQHAGVIVGLGGVAGHPFRFFKRGENGYANRLTYAQDLSSVTGACLMMPRHVFTEVNGLDEKFAVAYNDVDLCMRIRGKGYLVVWTPYSEAYHYESVSRGLDDTPEKRERYMSEVRRFQTVWEKELQEGDPYYNPNLTIEMENFSVNYKPSYMDSKTSR